MMMNLVKYWSRELLKLSFCHALGIFPTSKKGEARNITSSFTFFNYLKSSFFPDSCFARQLPILAGSFPPTTFGVKKLNFCVRHGNRCILLAIATALSLSLHAQN